MTQRYLNVEVFARLSVADKMRAYLVLRTTPTRAKVLQKISGGTNAGISLGDDIAQGLIFRCSLGHYILTRQGRKVITERLPAGVLAVGIEKKAS